MVVYNKSEPHSSHVMSEWEGTVVTIMETSRFGSLRRCVNCGAEQAKTAAGQAMHDALALKCPDAPDQSE